MASFATPTDLTYRLRQDVDTNSAQAILDDVSEDIRVACNQTISLVTNDVQVLRVTPRGSTLVLPERPAQQPTAITINGNALAAWYWDGIDTVSLIPLVPINGVMFDSEYPLSLIYTAFPGSYPGYWSATTVTVTYTHGSNASDWLAAAKSACLSAAARVYTNPEGTTSEQIDDYAKRTADQSQGLLSAAEVKRVKSQYGRSAAMAYLGTG